jgi:hypothetical protein
MTRFSEAVSLPSGDESIGPVTILDAEGRVLRVVSAEEFRRARPTAMPERLDDRRPLASMRTKRAQRRAGGEGRLAVAS